MPRSHIARGPDSRLTRGAINAAKIVRAVSSVVAEEVRQSSGYVCL